MADANKENDRYLPDSEIDKLTIVELKKYLRRHNQYVTGKKNELVLRAKGVQKLGLIDVNRAVNESAKEFEKRQTEKLVTPLGEKLPHPCEVKSWYKELYDVPDFSEKDIYNYFVLKMNSKKQLRSKIYYVDKHVHSIMYSDIDELCTHCFVKCKVIPSIPSANPKDNPDHDVWMCLSKVSGQVLSAECDCTVGFGEACNHVGALMYALADISSKKKDGTLASTSKKCVWDQFNNPRKRKLTPQKSDSLVFRKVKFGQEENKQPKEKLVKELFVPESKVNEVSLREKLLLCNPECGWLLNFIEKSDEQKIPKLLEIDFHYHDKVDLRSQSVRASIGSVFENMQLSPVECDRIEKLTRGQSKNILWEDERKTRLTVSHFGDIFNLKECTGPEALLKKMLYTTVYNKFVIWGRKHEPAARMKYKLTMKRLYPDVKVTETGLYVNPEAPYLGASPDGLVTYSCDGSAEQGLIEIKCPASDKWRSLSPEDCAKDSSFFSALDPVTNKCTLKLNHRYYFQIQGQMAVSGMKWCDFVIWTLGGVSIERVFFNPECWEKMAVKLKTFYTECFLPELFSRRVHRGLKLF